MAKACMGSFVLFKDGFGDVAVSNILKRLERSLKKLLQLFLATHPEHQVENVEIKGTPHNITCVKGKRRQIDTMKSGALAKLPSDILARFDEFKNSTVLSFDDIHELEEKVEKIVIPEPEKLSTPAADCGSPRRVRCRRAVEPPVCQHPRQRPASIP